MKNYNGYGSIIKMKGKRRKPYRVTVTVAYDTETKKQTRKNIGYFETLKDAKVFLAEYNSNPYDLSGLTFAEVYERWSKEYEHGISPYKAAYARCKALWDLPMSEIKVIHLETVLDSLDCSNSAMLNVKGLFNQIYRYAMRHEIVTKNYAALCKAVHQEETERTGLPYTYEEEQKLWDNCSGIIPYILIGIYSGWRVREVLSLEIRDGCMWGGSKTEAGRNRCVPIHPKIKDLCDEYEPFKTGYHNFRKYFVKTMEELGMTEHKANDSRHTFATRCDEKGVKDAVRKQLMGHKSKDVTERHYTHRTIELLRNEIEKL